MNDESCGTPRPVLRAPTLGATTLPHTVYYVFMIDLLSNLAHHLYYAYESLRIRIQSFAFMCLETLKSYKLRANTVSPCPWTHSSE